VKKPNVSMQWYGAGSDVIYQSDFSGNNGTDYIFLGGRRLASYDENTWTINHYFQDALGSTRLVVPFNSNSVCYDADFYPGVYPERGRRDGERVATSTCAPSYKFTGMMRDGTGDEHTQYRQYLSNLGRWASPDPLAGDVTNPQSLNRYAYVMNNPTTLTDPLGLQTPKDGDPCGNNPGKASCGGDAASSILACIEAGYNRHCAIPPRRARSG
jgi:RHS repeat-associated protein